MFWHGAMCVCMGWVGSTDMNVGWAEKASNLAVCCTAVVGWCCGDVGSNLPTTGKGDGIRDTGMGETNAFSGCKGEMGETEGVIGSV